MQDELRRLPKVQTLLESAPAVRLIDVYGRADVASAIRSKLDDARTKIIAHAADPETPLSVNLLWDDIAKDLGAVRATTLKPTINATGVIIHTNLGRAPLAPQAMEAVHAVAETYSTLEYDLDTGKRGSRHRHVEDLICQLTGAEAALVVNNCAGAILTCLCALSAGQEVIASRGEMVEIGGSFRMPDVIAQSGATLKEIGTTNKTHLSDYADAISDKTALLLKSHTSNYAIVGFTSSPAREELATLAHDTGNVFVEDLGSGVLVDLAPYGLPNEPVVKDVLAADVDVVTFSGDKLLGGPQAGIIAGRRDLIDLIKKHPMARAVRVDKLSLAALHATLDLYRAPNNPVERIPVLQKIAEPIEDVKERAARLCDLLALTPNVEADLMSTTARAGGGSLPQQDLPSFAVALKAGVRSADAIAETLRHTPMPVIGRITKDRFLLDMRAVAPDEVEEIAAMVELALAT